MDWKSFILGLITVILLFISFISWLGIKYDIIDRDKRNKELELELEKLKCKSRKRTGGKNNVKPTK